MTIILLFCSLFLPFILGLALLSLIQQKAKYFLPTLQLYSLAFFLGTSIFTLILFSLSILGINWDKILISSVLGSISLIILAKLHFNEINQRIKKIFTERFNLETTYMLLFLLIIFKLVTISYLAIDKPITDWDAWSNWSLRAKVFYFEQGVNLNKNSAYFLGAGGHLDYPLQFPILEAWIYTVLGEWNDQLVKIVFPVYATFFVVFLYSFFSEKISKLSSLLFVFLFISLPLVSYHGSSAYMDLPLGLYLGMATMLLFNYLKTKKATSLLFVSLLLGATGWIKNEGLLFFIITILFTAMITHRQRMVFLTAGLIFILPWNSFKITENIGISNLSNSQLDKFVIHFGVFPEIIKGLFSLSNFSVLLFAFFIGIIIGGKNLWEKQTSKIILLPVLYLLIFIIIYLFTENYQFLLDGTVLQRNLLTIIPTIFWITALLWSNYFVQEHD